MKSADKMFEINTRVWIKRFSNERKKNVQLKDVPKKYWQGVKELGINAVWLMGVWKLSNKEIVEKYCFEEGLVKNYSKALKDWKKEDVIGSPYSIEDYVVNPNLGDREQLIDLKKYLNSLGISLILDLVPNHLSAGSPLIKSDPNIFLTVSKEFYEKDPHTYFKPFKDEEFYLAHGRDPFFPAWQDTAQINIFSDAARKYLINVLQDLTTVCDGVRCDMSILALNNIFKNTWGSAISNNGQNVPVEEFWKEAISSIKQIRSDFTFIAEAYWGLEWDLQQLGFDYTYDKTLYDRLLKNNVDDIKYHLFADQEFQRRSLRFIENHDEPRARASLGKQKSKAAAVIMSAVLGGKLYYDGQFVGKKIRLPVQLGREPLEPEESCIKEFYENLLEIIKDPIFQTGNWTMLDPIAAWDQNLSFYNMIAWEWRNKRNNRLIVVNYSEQPSQCRIKLDVAGYDENIAFVDLLDGREYVRSTEEVFHSGLYIELRPFQSHIFSY